MILYTIMRNGHEFLVRHDSSVVGYGDYSPLADIAIVTDDREYAQKMADKYNGYIVEFARVKEAYPVFKRQVSLADSNLPALIWALSEVMHQATLTTDPEALDAAMVAIQSLKMKINKTPDIVGIDGMSGCPFGDQEANNQWRVSIAASIMDLLESVIKIDDDGVIAEVTGKITRTNYNLLQAPKSKMPIEEKGVM